VIVGEAAENPAAFQAGMALAWSLEPPGVEIRSLPF